MVSGSPVPVVDLQGDNPTRAMDRALHEVGFLLITGHGVDPALLADARREALAFFHAPTSAKAAVAIDDDAYRGWVPTGAETNAKAYGLDGPPDLKESFIMGPHGRPDDAYHRSGARWYVPNRWPSAALRSTFTPLFDAFDALALRLLALSEEALGVETGTFTESSRRGMSSLVANWYPPGRGIAHPEGTYRIGPHTDYGGFTLLDRQQGKGGLQLQQLDDSWVDAPTVKGALTVNTGDLISHWTAGRWRSTRHRVLPPPADVPEEELLSLVFFSDPDHDAVITPLGRFDIEPVLAGNYLATKIAALTGAP